MESKVFTEKVKKSLEKIICGNFKNHKKTKVFATKIKKSLEKICRGNLKNHKETIMMKGIEAEIDESMIFFDVEDNGIYVRFVKENIYLFTATFKLHDSVEQIEEIIQEEMTKTKDKFNKVIDSLNNVLN